MLADFKPDLVINSAGQDNHFTDPLANMKLSAQGYAALNRALNPDIAVLEGGYAIRGALPYVNLGICLALAGLDAAWNAGFRGTKLNAVLLGGVNEDEIPALAQLAQDGEFEVRFIELMPIGECADWPRERFLSADAVLHALPELQRLPNEGVAELYRMPGWKGKIGLIRPMSHRFCADCDRIRVTADGRLKPCLHSAQEIPLRGLHGENLERALREGMFGKPVSHHMQSGQPSESRRGMSQIGG